MTIPLNKLTTQNRIIVSMAYGSYFIDALAGRLICKYQFNIENIDQWWEKLPSFTFKAEHFHV